MKNIAIGLVCGVALAVMLGQANGAPEVKEQSSHIATSSSEDGRTLYIWQVDNTVLKGGTDIAGCRFLGCATVADYQVSFAHTLERTENGKLQMAFAKVFHQYFSIHEPTFKTISHPTPKP